MRSQTISSVGLVCASAFLMLGALPAQAQVITGTQDFTITVEEPPTADPFSFDPAIGSAGATVTSVPVLISGFSGTLPISISGDGAPSYSLDGVSFTDQPGVVPSDTNVLVRLAASPVEGEQRTATLDIDGVAGSFMVTTEDLTPNSFTFASVTSADLSQVVESAPATISGVIGSVPLSVEAVFGAEYNVNGTGWVSAAGTIEDGGTIAVRLTSADDFSAERSVGLTIGTVTESFSVTTRPFVFSVADVQGAPIDEDVVSDIINLPIQLGSVPISVSGEGSPAYSINGGDFTSSSGTVSGGQQVRIRLRSASTGVTSRSAQLNIGSSSDTFTVQTLVPPIEFVSAGRGTASLVQAEPTWVEGDLIVAFAYCETSTCRLPSLPSGWTDGKTENDSSFNKGRVAHRIATNDLTTGDFGNWVSASQVHYLVYRNARQPLSVEILGETGRANSYRPRTSVRYRGINRLNNTGAWSIYFTGHESTATLSSQPAFMTERNAETFGGVRMISSDSNGPINNPGTLNYDLGGSSGLTDDFVTFHIRLGTLQ